MPHRPPAQPDRFPRLKLWDKIIGPVFCVRYRTKNWWGVWGLDAFTIPTTGKITRAWFWGINRK